MNIYDKTQEQFHRHALDRSGIRHFNLTMVMVGILLVLLLGLLIVLLAWPGFYVQRAGTYALLGIAAVFSAYELFFSASEKRILKAPRAYHDYLFCLYRDNRSASASKLLIQMAETDVIENQISQAIDALGQIHEGSLNSRLRKRYKTALSEVDTGVASAAYRSELIRRMDRKIRLSAFLQVITALILLISLASIIMLISLSST